jgi:hypothetical protein
VRVGEIRQPAGDTPGDVEERDVLERLVRLTEALAEDVQQRRPDLRVVRDRAVQAVGIQREQLGVLDRGGVGRSFGLSEERELAEEVARPEDGEHGLTPLRVERADLHGSGHDHEAAFATLALDEQHAALPVPALDRPGGDLLPRLLVESAEQRRPREGLYSVHELRVVRGAERPP